MDHVLAPLSTSISELKRNPSGIIERAGGEPVAILNHNRPTAYLVPAKAYEAMLDALDDLELAVVVRARQGEKKKAVAMALDDL